MKHYELLLKEARNNGTYKLYLNTVDGLKAFYENDLETAKAIFTDMKAKNIPGDLYAPLFKDYLKRIEEAEKATE